MYEVNQETQNAIDETSRKWIATISCDSSELDVDIKSMTVSCVNNALVGGALSTCVNLELDDSDTELEGKNIEIALGLQVGEVIVVIPVGSYTVTEASNKTYTAYDVLYTKGAQSFESELEYPATVVAVLEEAAAQLGTALEIADSVSDALREGEIQTKPEGYSLRQIIGYLSACLAGFAYINRQGALAIAQCMSGSLVEVDEDHYYQDDLEMAEKDVTITALSWEDSDEEVHIAGTGTAMNIQCPIMTEAIFNEVASVLIGITYRSISVKMLGNPLLDIGDRFALQKGEGTIIGLCSSVTHAYDGGLTTTLESSGESEAELEASTDGQYSIEIKKTNKLLKTKVSKGTVSSEISQEADKVSIKGNRLIIECDNFAIDESGNVRISGDVHAKTLTANEVCASEEFSIYKTEFYSGESYKMFETSIQYTDYDANSETGISTEITADTDNFIFKKPISAPNLKDGTVTIVVDEELSTTSENPVQNKIITAKLNEIVEYVSNISAGGSNKGIIETSVDVVTQVVGCSDSSSDYVDYEKVEEE